jgi:hypothetical protein
VVLAARGSRNLDSGEEKINDSGKVADLRLVARGIHLKTILTALLLTLLGLYF